MEDLDDYISSGSQRKAAMTLDDLSLPSFVQDVDVESTTTDGGGLEFSRDPNDYKKELTKLLRKSRGTPYEKTLRKFVETKLREISKDIFEKSKPDPASKVINSIAQQRTEGSPVRASLASLSTSKYDDANYSTVGRFRLAQQQTSENKIRLDEMARPLDRHKYKGSDKPYSLSTNNIGRQRPPPKEFHTSSVLYSPYKMNKPLISSRLRPSLASAPSSRPVSPTQTRSRSSSRRGQRSPVRMNTTVSMGEFRDWLRTNRNWDRRAKTKVENSKARISNSFQESSQPRISRRSIKLAELAHQRESQVYLELVAEKQAPKSPEDSNYRRSNSAGPRNRSVSPSGRESLGDAHSVASAVTNGSVFERLSARGLVGREKQMRAVSAQRELMFRDMFVPQLSDRTVQLAERRRMKQLQPFLAQTSDESPAELLERAQSVPRLLTEPVPIRSMVRSGSFSTLSFSQLHGGAQHLSHPQRSSSPVPPSLSVVSQNVLESIAKAKEKAQNRRWEREEHERRRNFLRADSPQPKPFQPHLVATSTSLSNNSSFAERNLVAVERQSMRKVMSSLSPSPGPGHYTGLVVKGQKVHSSPSKRVNVSQERTLSPGHRGYSFGRSKGISSIYPEEVQQEGRIYAFHSPVGGGSVSGNVNREMIRINTTTGGVNNGNFSVGSSPPNNNQKNGNNENNDGASGGGGVGTAALSPLSHRSR